MRLRLPYLRRSHSASAGKVCHWRSPLGTAGNSAIEFALVAPLFFLMLFAVADFSRLLFAQMILQEALRDAGRYATTGNHLPDPNNPNQNLTRVQSIIHVAQNHAGGFDVSALNVSSAAGGNGSAGGPGDIVTLTLNKSLPLMTPVIGRFFPNQTFTFKVSVSFKNESFPPSNTT
jgi:TadE-like protein